ncbi:MAG: VacJ family lipoprotein [Candidatus Sumerlaeia bacterium]
MVFGRLTRFGLALLILMAQSWAAPPVPVATPKADEITSPAVPIPTPGAAAVASPVPRVILAPPAATPAPAPAAVPVAPAAVPVAPAAEPAPLPTPGQSQTRVVMPSPNLVPTVIGDPIERYNRTMTSMNNGIAVWFFRPVVHGYRFIFPARVRTHIGKFGNNLAYPVRLFGNLLQAKWGGAGSETGRFLINTTVGLLGFFDPAEKIGLHESKEDFGQAFGKWGNGPGFYFTIPFMGPSSGRDALGGIFDMALSPATYVPGLSLFFQINTFSFKLDDYIRLLRSERDPYVLVRDLWSLNREREVIDYTISTKEIVQPNTTLQAVFLAVQDPAFPGKTQERKVRAKATGEMLHYNLWLQPRPAPLVFILPGLGGHRASSMSAALAEMVYRQGFSAVTISSPFNWDFMTKGSSVDLPGYTPVDAADMYNALKAIRTDLNRRYDRRVTSYSVAGLSIGALHTLFISSLDEDKVFSRYVAINPPLDVRHALEMLDNYYQAPLDWPAAERDERQQNTLMKAIKLSQGNLTPSDELPFSPNESRYLIGLYYHLTLRDIIYTSQLRENQGVITRDLKTHRREPVYHEINHYIWLDYLDKFVVPYYQRRMPGVTADQLVYNASVWSIQDSIAANPDVRAFINTTDFLLNENDIDRMSALLHDRLTVFPGGGHVGNLYKPDIQKTIMQSLEDLK